MDSAACSCRFIHTSHVMPGWGCCRCGLYNGLQRERCRFCGHAPPALEVPSSVNRCSACGFGFDGNPVTPCPCCGVTALDLMPIPAGAAN